MPTGAQASRAAELVEQLRVRHRGRIVIDAVVPDYYARYPKPCLGGWARRSLNVTPSGKVLPCHAAETIPHLEFGMCASTHWLRFGRARRFPSLSRDQVDARALPQLSAP